MSKTQKLLLAGIICFIIPITTIIGVVLLTLSAINAYNEHKQKKLQQKKTAQNISDIQSNLNDIEETLNNVQRAEAEGNAIWSGPNRNK